MAAQVEAMRARKAALKMQFLAREQAEHGPHKVHPPRQSRPRAHEQKEWADRMVSLAEQTRQRSDEQAKRDEAAAVEATRRGKVRDRLRSLLIA